MEFVFMKAWKEGVVFFLFFFLFFLRYYKADTRRR